MTKRRTGCGLLFVFLTAVLIGVALLGGYLVSAPYFSAGQPVFVEIDHGTSSRAMARRLASDGVVRSPWVFLLVRALHPGAKLQAGEYRFDGAESAWQVFEKIRRGEIFYEDITVPEGSNMFDIAGILRSGDTVRPDAFLKAASDGTLIHDLDPAAPNLEGYLFPSTYRVTHKTTAHELCRTMTAEFRKQWAAATAGGVSIDVHRAVTLASIVEKESAVKSERPLIASVYLNRLAAGMPLQCDPTTIYAALLDKRYTGVIHRSDLASTNAYNTYTHVGLPPGPIANPGRGALDAVLHPEKSSYLYFVARGDGSGAHQFSTTFEEHNKAVAAYRRTLHHP